MSDINPTVLMENSSSTMDTLTSSDHGHSAYPGTHSYNYPSTAASIASSDADYQHDLTNSSSTLPLSLPLSRLSTTSCLSVTLFKDGVEGKRIHRSGISSYPYNLIATMADNRRARSPLGPINNAVHQELRDPEEWSNDSSKSVDNDRQDHMNIPAGPPVSLNEKMKLLKTGQVQKKDILTSPDGPSVGPVVFKKGIDMKENKNVDIDGDDDDYASYEEYGYNNQSDDVSMTDYTRFQKEEAAKYKE